MTSRAILLGWPLIPPSKALSAPSFSVQAAISGSFAVGSVLTGSYTLTGFPAPTVTTRWVRDGVTIPGATGSTYTVLASDVDHEIGYHVFASNGSGMARSTASGVVPNGGIPAPPSGQGYVYTAQGGQNNAVYITLNGISYPLTARAA